MLIVLCASASTSTTSRPSATRAAAVIPIRCARAAIARAGGRRRHHRASARGPPPHLRRRHRRGCSREIDLPLNLRDGGDRRDAGDRAAPCPHAACMVPEKREERTTEGGLDVARPAQPPARLSSRELRDRRHPRLAVHRARSARSSTPRRPLGAPVVELHTGAYCDAWRRAGARRAPSSTRMRRRRRAHAAARARVPCRPRPDLRHGRRRSRRSPSVVELNIGHFLIGEAIFVGLDAAIRRMRALMDEARAGGERAPHDPRHRQRPHRHPPHREDARALRRALHRAHFHRRSSSASPSAAPSAPPPTPSASPPRRPAPRRWAPACATASSGATWAS